MQRSFNFHGDNALYDVRPTAKKLALEMGFDHHHSYTLASSITELIQSVSAIGRNVQISLRVVKNRKNHGLELIFNVSPDKNYKNNFSINGHLGSGFENIKRKMDDFCISSSGGEFKLVTRKWMPIA
jgi:anti-sigma regulatory factor (Ser/Thr protein kinase)